jgi:hypothetical protein
VDKAIGGIVRSVIATDVYVQVDGADTGIRADPVHHPAIRTDTIGHGKGGGDVVLVALVRECDGWCRWCDRHSTNIQKVGNEIDVVAPDHILDDHAGIKPASVQLTVSVSSAFGVSVTFVRSLTTRL